MVLRPVRFVPPTEQLAVSGEEHLFRATSSFRPRRSCRPSGPLLPLPPLPLLRLPPLM